VIDSIRNLKEVEHLRKTYPNFFLIAVDSSPCFRWERLKLEFKKQGKTEDDFEEYDRRDKNEEWTTHGQQVELCVDDADLMIVNDEQFATSALAEDKLRAKIEPYVNLLSGQRRPPTPFESYMNLAYSASLMSQCIKRRVGAVIVDEPNEAILSVGYNENPSPIPPCLTQYFQCYRDIHKVKNFENLERKGEKCPKCGQPLKHIKPPFLCENTIDGDGKCNFDLDKHFTKDKIMSRCTALHAEERAILTAGSRNIEDCTIYTTTFPCFTCAQKIVFSKLKSVVYVEPYPDNDSIKLLKDARIAVRKFEGIKAKAFFRIFGPWQREVEMGLKATV
jgi:deoxycytidylate deaminase